MPKTHFLVYYICECDGYSKPVKQARPIKRDLEDRMMAISGMEKLQKVVKDSVSHVLCYQIRQSFPPGDTPAVAASARQRHI